VNVGQKLWVQYDGRWCNADVKEIDLVKERIKVEIRFEGRKMQTRTWIPFERVRVES
jgi:hypothetical protein